MNHHIFDENDCTLANGTFYYASKTKDDCLRSNYSYCWTPQSIVTGLLSPRDSVTGNCSVGASPQNLFQWKDAQWIGGTWAYTNWTTRRFVEANAIQQTIDFISLQSVVTFPSALSVKNYLQNQV